MSLPYGALPSRTVRTWHRYGSHGSYDALAKKPFYCAPRFKKCIPHRLCFILLTEHSSSVDNSFSSLKWKRKPHGEDPVPNVTLSTCVTNFTRRSGLTSFRQIKETVRPSIPLTLMMSCAGTRTNITPVGPLQAGASVSVLPACSFAASVTQCTKECTKKTN